MRSTPANVSLGQKTTFAAASGMSVKDQQVGTGDTDHIVSDENRRDCRHHQREATMRKYFLIAAILLSATAAHAGPELTVAAADVQPTAPSSAQLPDANVLAVKRQAIVQQKMAMQKQKQMAMQREMQRHPIRTRLHFAFLKFKQRLHRAY